MDTTLTDHRPALWTARLHEQERLAWHRLARHMICGCTRCGDADQGERLDELIKVCLARIIELEDQICEGAAKR